MKRNSPAEAHLTLAERLELPGLVADALDYDDLTDLVAAFLGISGHPVERAGDVLRLDEAVVIVGPADIGEPIGREVLNAAYGRYLSSGAACGLFVTAGRLPVEEVRRREELDPHFMYAGCRDLQTMAEAAAAGEDPLAGWLPAANRR